jgi:hypothetical protein
MARFPIDVNLPYRFSLWSGDIGATPELAGC